MHNNHSLVVAATPQRNNQFTAQAKHSHVKAFEASKRTMTDYCKRHGLALSTFSKWVRKYGNKEAASFAPVQVQRAMPTRMTPANKQITQAQAIEIHRGDLKVVLPAITDVATTVELIKGVLSCNYN